MAATELNVAWATNEGRRLPVRWKRAHRVMASIKSTGKRTGSRCSRANSMEDASAERAKMVLLGGFTSRSGGEEDPQPVEAVEDGAPEDQFLYCRTEEYDDQDYRRYRHARALVYPANEPFHKRLLDRRSRRVAELFEDEDADRGQDHAEDYGTDAYCYPAPMPARNPPLGRENPRGAREYPTFLPSSAAVRRPARIPRPRSQRRPRPIRRPRATCPAGQASVLPR